MTRPVPSRFRLSVPHAAAAGALFGVEVLIARFVHDGFVRPYIGDVLVVLLVHHALLSVIEVPVPASASGVLAFACAVEGAQYAGVGEVFDGHPILQTIVGTTFQWGDLVAYTAGALVAVAVDGAIGKVARGRGGRMINGLDSPSS